MVWLFEVQVGDVICEFHKQGKSRKVIEINDDHVVCERNGRKTKIAKKNLYLRYKKISQESDD